MDRKEKLQDALSRIVEEAMDLRFGEAGDAAGAVYLPETDQGPQAILDSLVRVRRRLDRVEYLLAQVVRLRGTASRSLDVVQAEADDAWDRHVVEQRRAPVRRGDDFTGPREKYAEASVATMEQKIAAREAQEISSKAVEAEQIVRTLYRGLDALRYDHIAVLNGLNVLHQLER